MRSFDILNGGSRPRLANLRAAAVKLAANPHRNMQTATNPDWRTVRYGNLRSSDNAGFGCNPGPRGSKRAIFTTFEESAIPARRIRFADEIAGSYIDHRGWYADADGAQGTIRGIVASLPHGRFLSGYYWSDNGEYVLFIGPGQVFTYESQAAREADHEAERYADICREDNERFHAMQDAESRVEELNESLCDAWALRRMGRRSSDAVRELIESLREAREALQDATRAYEGA